MQFLVVVGVLLILFDNMTTVVQLGNLPTVNQISKIPTTTANRSQCVRLS